MLVRWGWGGGGVSVSHILCTLESGFNFRLPGSKTTGIVIPLDLA